MLCPSCKESDNNVIDSRLTEGGMAVRRRRECRLCQRRFTTKERVEEELRLSVIKADRSRAPYRRGSIVRGVEQACVKLNVTDEMMQQMVDQVEEDLFSNHDREVTTEQIGLYVGQHLRRLNQVAYVRFMSVYRKFKTVEEFVDEVSEVRVRVAEENPAQQALFGT